MKKIQRLTELRQDIAAFRSAGERIALVPTMGNLHQGHLQLVKEARRLADRVVATVFVNPTQFGPGEDYASYPRTPEADRAALAQAGFMVVVVDRRGRRQPGHRYGVLNTKEEAWRSEYGHAIFASPSIR